MANNDSRLPCESLIIQIFGDRWRELPSCELDGVWGVAIVRSILDGVPKSIRSLSDHLGVPYDVLRLAFTRLNLNGVFLKNRIYDDRKPLNRNDDHAWCQYAGIASGATGNVICEPKKNRERS